MKNCETVGSAVRSNTSAVPRATADFNLLALKNVILCPNQAQIRDKTRFTQNVYKLRLMTKPLTLVKIVDRILYRTDGVTQVSIVSPTISGVDSGRFDGDELLSLPDNFVVPLQKKLFRSAMSFENYHRTRLA